MEEKVYRGQSMQEVLQAVRRDLGQDAVIVGTRQLSQGSFEVHASRNSTLNPNSARSQSSNTARSVVARLKRQGLAQGLLETLLQTSFRASRESDGGQRGTRLEKVLSHTFSFSSVLPHAARIVALVGPTGVGKTTTIAKLAARIREAYGIRIALIAADTYRIGGGYQLHTYGTLLKMPCRVISPEGDFHSQLRSAISALANADLILVDTNGCSPRDEQTLARLEDNLAPFPEIERVLVLPAPSNELDLRTAAGRFLRLGVSRVTISKLDESGYIGPVLNTAHALGKPLAFFTTGQRVPEDIEPATARRLAWMLMRQVH
ncbi:MAG: hypothetical protein KDD64_07405 [Bdellovibrionales bacterium]|nr:hypothetical protein [Bdellovibrionales bacterium]